MTRAAWRGDGHFMMRSITMLAALAGLAVAGAAPAAEPEPCRLVRFGTLDLVGTPAEVPRVDATVNGVSGSFTLDTGGAWSLLPASLAAGLPRTPLPRGMYFTDAAGTRITTRVTAPALEFGPFKLKDVQFVDGAIAALGANILSALDVELDPVERKVGLFQHKTCPGVPAYWPHSDLTVVPFETNLFKHILVEAKLDGREFAALIDTGATMTELSAREARLNFGVTTGTPDAPASFDLRAAGGDPVHAYRHQFEKLELGGLAILHPWLRLHATGRAAQEIGGMPPLIIGMSTLAAFHIYFAYDEQKIYLTTVRGDLAAGRKPPDGAAVTDGLSQINEREQLESAWNAVRAGDTARARALYDRAVQLGPDDARALAARASFLFRQHDEAGAGADLERLAKLPLSTADGFLARASAYQTNRRFDLALADASTAVERWPRDAGALNARCWIEALRDRLDAALADCNAAVALAPKASAILDSRAFVQLKAGRLDLAITDYDAAIKLDPRNASSLYGRSLARRRQGDTAGAEEDREGALKLAPDIETTFGT